MIRPYCSHTNSLFWKVLALLLITAVSFFLTPNSSKLQPRKTAVFNLTEPTVTSTVAWWAWKLCILVQSSNAQYTSVFERKQAVNMCKDQNATLPYTLEHVNALHELNLLRLDTGKNIVELLSNNGPFFINGLRLVNRH